MLRKQLTNLLMAIHVVWFVVVRGLMKLVTVAHRIVAAWTAGDSPMTGKASVSPSPSNNCFCYVFYI